MSSGINKLSEGPMTMTEPNAVHFWLAMSSTVTFGITWVMSSAPGHSWLCFNPAALVFLSGRWKAAMARVGVRLESSAGLLSV